MNYLYGLVMAWGMFTIIPCPVKKWKEEARGHMLVMLTVIGAILGTGWMLIYCLKDVLPFFLWVVAMAAYPWLITGFMHLDGYMDVCDAILSRRDLEIKQRILKDSRCGAFAVIAMVLLALFQIAAVASFGDMGVSVSGVLNNVGIAISDSNVRRMVNLVLIMMAVRTCSGLAVMNMKPISSSQYNGENTTDGKGGRTVLLVAALIIEMAVGIVFTGNIVTLVSVACYWICVTGAAKSLGGISGDVSGYALTIAELVGLIGLI